MKAKVERTGGFAGGKLTSACDTEQLDSGDAQKLRQLVTSAKFFNLPASIMPAKAQPDRFQYRVTIEDGGRVYSVTVCETELTPSLRSLTDFLMRHARRR